MKKYTVYFFLSLAVLSGCIGTKQPKDVVAKVGRNVFSNEDVNNRIIAMEPSMQKMFDEKENRVRLLDQMIQEEVLYQLAKKERLQQDSEYKKLIENIEKQALVNYFIDKRVNQSVEVSKSEVESYFKENQAQYSEYEMRKLSHILVANEAVANQALGALKKGESFAAVAKKFSTDGTKARGGDLGWVRKSDLIPDFANVAFSLTKKGSYSGLVKTQFGIHIIQYNDTRRMPPKSLDDAYQEISQRLLSDKRLQTFNEIVDNGKASLTVERTIDNL